MSYISEPLTHSKNNKEVKIDLSNYVTNFIPHETKIFNDREPPWMNKKVKTMIQEEKISALFEK